MTRRFRELALELLAAVTTASSALAAHPTSSFPVASTLDGDTVLPLRTRWTARSRGVSRLLPFLAVVTAGAAAVLAFTQLASSPGASATPARVALAEGFALGDLTNQGFTAIRRITFLSRYPGTTQDAVFFQVETPGWTSVVEVGFSGGRPATDLQVSGWANRWNGKTP